MQERLESSPAGRRIIALFLTAILLAILVSNLPASELKRRTFKAAAPVLYTTGLRQSWGVFAPKPPRTTKEVVARIEYADGSRRVWRTPRGGRVLDVYHSFRWRKLAEAVQKRRSQALARNLARWLARTEVRDGRAPVRIEVVRRFRRIPPPGDADRRVRWRQKVLYTHEPQSPARRPAP